jgi:hypothetical protein
VIVLHVERCDAPEKASEREVLLETQTPYPRGLGKKRTDKWLKMGVERMTIWRAGLEKDSKNQKGV